MTRLARLLLPAALLALALSGCSLSLQEMPKPGGLSGSTYSVTATFDDVLNLPDNAEIREGARVVGEVGAMTIDGYRANVELRFLDEVLIPRGTTVEVRFDNPLGDQYVEVRRPDEDGIPPPLLRDGDTIAVNDTTAAPTVEDTLGAFATVLTGGGIGDLHLISRELNAVFSGNQKQIRQLVGRLETSAELLADGLGPIDRALTQVNRLVEQLNDGSDVLVAGLKEVAPALKVLGDLNDDFATLLKGLDEFARSGNVIVARSGEQTVRALQDLEPVVEQIVDSRELLTPVLANVRVLAQQVPKVTKYGYARVSVLAPVAFSSAPSQASGTIRQRSTVSSLMTPLGPLESRRNR